MGSLLHARVLHCGPYRLPLTTRPYLMGIINLTPDSFSDGGLLKTPAAAYHRAQQLIAAGADILDLGAESSRPGAEPLPVSQEKKRLLPALKLITRLNRPVSVDTYKPEVAAAALAAGACLLNDINGLRDPDMRRLAARTRVPVVIMHLRGTPRTMQQAPRYTEVVKDVCRSLQTLAKQAEAAGVARNKIILDPGIGFGKTLTHNLQLLQNLPRLLALGYPIMVGPSRKSFLAKIMGPLPPPARIWGTAAAIALATAAGVQFLRVHDVGEMRMVAQVAQAIAWGTARPWRPV